MIPSLRRLCLFAAFVLLFMLAACGQNEPTQTAVLPTTAPPTNTPEPTATATNTPQQFSK